MDYVKARAVDMFRLEGKHLETTTKAEAEAGMSLLHLFLSDVFGNDEWKLMLVAYPRIDAWFKSHGITRRNYRGKLNAILKPLMRHSEANKWNGVIATWTVIRSMYF